MPRSELCADCGAPLGALSVDLRGAVLCLRCAAVHALALDPKASARETRQASFVLSLAAALLEDERLAHLAGLGRPGEGGGHAA